MLGKFTCDGSYECLSQLVARASRPSFPDRDLLDLLGAKDQDPLRPLLRLVCPQDLDGQFRMDVVVRGVQGVEWSASEQFTFPAKNRALATNPIGLT
jgi:hypothetical protein